MFMGEKGVLFDGRNLEVPLSVIDKSLLF